MGDALVKSGSQSARASFNGEYLLEGLPPGPATLVASADWFQEQRAQGVVPAGGTGSLDIRLDEMPLKVEAADQALVESYNKTYDWTKADLY
ncbi:MAG: carboxypeptidase-like regulatory domain-containing protein, partial [Anaerolineae bacterium]|nr:carboxypeptidase-like regulatory domain-containing protein [Anaerolineae bacterium]